MNVIPESYFYVSIEFHAHIYFIQLTNWALFIIIIIIITIDIYYYHYLSLSSSSLYELGDIE